MTQDISAPTDTALWGLNTGDKARAGNSVYQQQQAQQWDKPGLRFESGTAGNCAETGQDTRFQHESKES